MITQTIFEKGITLAKLASFVPRQNFPDSGIIYKAKNDHLIKKIAVGVDVEAAELLYAHAQNCDLVIAHHPVGVPSVRVAEEILFHNDNLGHYGVPGRKIAATIEKSAQKERRRSAAYNLTREASLAKDMDMDFIVLHTPMDIVGVKRMETLLTKEKCHTLEDCLDLLGTLEEFSMARAFGQEPFIAHGEPTAKIGKISFTEFLGAEESSPEIFLPLKEAGVDTILVPHFSEDFFHAAKDANLQIIYCGHMASDSLGINIFLDTLLAEDPTIKIMPLGGLLRTKN